MASDLAPAVANGRSLSASPALLAEAIRRRGLDEFQWSTLCSSLFPGARPESVLLAVDYCKARKLDPLKKPCHIVPMEVKNAQTGAAEWRDVILPGIYEHRVTAQRTGQYLGHTPPTWGSEIEYKGVKCFEWCGLTMFRRHTATNTNIEFPVRVYFREVCVTTRDGKPNARWTRAPIQMLLKCTEAAGLREAFPDEIGGELTAEEMDGARLDESTTIDVAPAIPKPAGFDPWIVGLEAVAAKGVEALKLAWKAAPKECREYLQAADPALWATLKTRAAEGDAIRNPAPTNPPTPDTAA